MPNALIYSEWQLLRKFLNGASWPWSARRAGIRKADTGKIQHQLSGEVLEHVLSAKSGLSKMLPKSCRSAP